MNATLTWGGSALMSVAAHLAVALAVAAMIQPHAIQDQPQPKSELRIETQEVARSDATLQQANAPQAAAASTKGSQLSEGVVPQSRAESAAPKQDRLAASQTAAPAAKAAAPPAQKLAAAAAPAVTPAASLPQTAALKPATSGAVKAVAAAPPAQSLSATAAPRIAAPAQDLGAMPLAATADTAIPLAAISDSGTALAAFPDNATPLAATPDIGTRLAAAPDIAIPLAAAAADSGTDLAAAVPDTAPAAQAIPDLQQAAAAPATGDRMVASLAFSGEGGQIDPVSVKAIASFMQPGDTAARADETRDALSQVLTSVPCSRLQAEFNPETGSLDLRGHVPDPAMKGPVLAALQAQLGTAIKVNDAMLILPRPQCGALAGIANVGLPQSQDQNTNPRLIGDDAQSRAYDYSAGQTLVLDLAAPEYDAYVYVDYFAADGSVIHLVPNDTVPLRLRSAKTAMRVGAPDADEPFLNITIGPPFGQEIAAAFAASAPLYEGVRPLSEPAGPYLDYLKTQVAAARAADPDFKGEWVYFFVSTRDN